MAVRIQNCSNSDDGIRYGETGVRVRVCAHLSGSPERLLAPLAVEGARRVETAARPARLRGPETQATLHNTHHKDPANRSPSEINGAACQEEEWV